MNDVVAEEGVYPYRMKVTDGAGNTRETGGTIEVEWQDLLYMELVKSNPANQPSNSTGLIYSGAYNPPAERVAAEELQPISPPNFGGASNGMTSEGQTVISVTGGRTVFNSESDYVKTGFTEGNESTATPFSNPNIVWGGIAAAILGATLADWQRKREEEKRKEGGSKAGRKAYEAWMKKKRIVGESQALLDEKAKEKAEQAEAARQNLIARNEDRAPVDMAKVNALVEAQQKAEQQAGLSAYYEGRKKGEENKPKAKTWWEKTVDWVDQHQVEISIGVGVAVGVAAIILSGGTATPLVAAAWIAGTAVVAGGAVALGTVGLNAYYDRDLGTNVVRNLLVAGTTAAVLTGASFILPGMAQSVGSYCALNPNTCAKVEPVMNAVDTAEEAWLMAKGSYQTWTGDRAGAADTALELQMERLDGGMPGNAVTKEVSEQLAKLGDDIPELIATYGDDIIPLLLKYQDDAIDIIGAYGDEGIALLQKFGEDAPEAIKLVKGFGTPAVQLLDTLDVKSAGALLNNLETDVLDYAVQQGPDAVKALSKWKPEELQEFGVELALRADKDAKAINALDQLTKLDITSADPKVQAEVARLIQEIADNSTHGSGDRFVLGTWDLENGISGGYVNDARVNGGYYYGSHPDIYNTLDALYGETNPQLKNDMLWALNQTALQKQIEKGVDFDYSMVSLIGKKYNQEVAAINHMIAGNPAQALVALERDTMPAKLKEVQILLDAGYTPEYDEAAKVFHWTLNK